MRNPFRFIRRGSYANVTATLALVLALGGTSYAVATITSADIVNGTIKTKDIANNAIKSPKVKDGSLLAADFAAGQLPAGPPGPQGPQGPQGPAGSDAIPNASLVALSSATTTTSTAYVNVPGMSTSVTVPDGGGRVLVTFSAESACYGASGYCHVRVLVDGVEINPAVSTDFAWDSTNNNNETAGSWESHSLQRFTGNLPAGNHSVVVQYATTANTITLRLDDGVLSTLVVR